MMWRRAFVSAAVCAGALAGGVGHAAAQERVVRGTVVSAGGEVPVAGAVVRVPASGPSVVTSADGTWRLTVPAGVHELLIEHLAYADARVAVATDGNEPVRVELTPRPVSLAELVVTASRRLQELADVAVATEVVGREEIERTGATDLAAVLVERTGVSLQGGHPVGAGVMLQGLGSERVLVLMDGEPFIGRIAGGLDLSRIPTAMIERVEVVKGPQSTLYGSEAMGGVVNVITRAPQYDLWKGSLDLTGGSNGRLDVAAHAMGGIGGAAYTVDAGRRTIELVPGFAGIAGTYATRWDGAARMQWHVDSAWAVNASALVLNEDQRWKSGVLYNFTDNLQWSGRLGAVRERGAHRFAPSLYATEFRHLSRRSTLPQPLENTGDETEVQRLLEAEMLYGYVGDRVALDVGVEARREAIHSDRVTGGDRTLHSVEPFAQATWSGDAWSLVPGVRMSWSEQWGTHVTPRIAAMARPLEQLALRASVGQGFRAPAFKELYMEFLNTGAGAGYRVQGNPDLRPETSANVSGSAEWAGDRLYARVQLFYNRFEDFIETRALPSEGGLSVFTYGNIDDGETYGAELEVGTTWGAIGAEAGYGWLEARDRATNEPLLGRPRHSGRAALTYTTPIGLRLNVSGTHTGATLVSRTDAGVAEERGSLTRIDVRAAQSLPHGLEVRAGLDNVLDATLEDYPGHLGRQLYLSIGWRVAGTMH